MKKLAMGLMGLLACGIANAATVYDLTDTAVGAFGSGPYGTVTLTQNGANVDVSVSLASGFDFVRTGNDNHSFFGMNVTGAVATDITAIKFNGVLLDAWKIDANAANDPYGPMTFGISCTVATSTSDNCKRGGSGKLSDPLTFKFLNALESDFVANSNGYLFTADVITGSATGLVAAPGTTPEVPLPGTLGLLGFGLAGLGAIRRKKSV